MQKIDDTERRLNFGHFVDRMFWFVLTAAALYTASSMKELGRSVEELNKNMSIVIYQITESKEWQKNTDSRIRVIEERQRR